jgi:hypothetical protein
MRRALAATGVVAATALGCAPALAAYPAGTRPGPDAAGIPLTTPVRDVDPLAGALGLGLRKDRLLKSVVPGPVVNSEQLTVAVGPTGAPALVTDTQQLLITRPGNYIVRELGPARKAEGLGDTVPPVLELGQVVWQGFSPNTRTLRARLTLDPGLEAHRLPMAVSLRFRDTRGRAGALSPGARAPADGTVTVTLSNQTAIPRAVPLGTGDTAAVAVALDRLYAAARAPRDAVPPYAGAGLPARVPGRADGQEQASVVAPLRVTGTIGVADAPPGSVTVAGPGTAAAPHGASVAGTLEGTASFDVPVRSGQHLLLDLDARPWLDPRLLVPPTGSTWRGWARTHPDAAAVTAATTVLAEAAASAARAAEYSPYLQADTPGSDLSSFRYVVASDTPTPRAHEVLKARPDGIAAAVVALAAIAGNAALLRRQL